MPYFLTARFKVTNVWTRSCNNIKPNVLMFIQVYFTTSLSHLSLQYSSDCRHLTRLFDWLSPQSPPSSDDRRQI